MDDKKQEYPKFTPTVKTIKISSPFINKTDGTKNTVEFKCTGVTHKTDKTHLSSDSNPVAQMCTQCNGILKLDTFGGLHCPYCGTIYK